MSFSYNKGEWSELYVLITLLAEGKLYQSDYNLNKDLNNVYDIIKAYKNQNDYVFEFVRNDEVKLYELFKGNKILKTTFSVKELSGLSKVLYKGIIKGKGKSFKIVEMNDFINASSIQSLKAKSSEKADIKLRIYDHRLAKETDLGFSIKSLLGGNSTLFNTGPGNNFVYKIDNFEKNTVSDFNERTYEPEGNISKITCRLHELKQMGSTIKFSHVQSEQLWKNLKMVDGDLPEILAWALYYRYYYQTLSLKKVTDILEIKDPINFYTGKISEQKLYEYKIKRFLSEVSMGMTSETPWLGEYDSFGGVIIAKNDGDIVCFHIYDFNLFRNYLLENTVFEQAATGEDSINPGTYSGTAKKKYYYGWLFEEDEELFIKINLQIRFSH